MIVFDVDGTLIGGESTDWECFRSAFQEVAGFTLDAAFFDGLEEVTAQAIVHQALSFLSLDDRKQKERTVCQGFLRRLESAHQNNASVFPAIDGATDLLRHLSEQGIPVAIATGDWGETISFKLWAAGIAFEHIPMATSSEYYSRADIIAGAVAQAGRTLRETVYVGDGMWDLRACMKLGIPFVGVGHRIEKLRAAGATHLLPNLNPSEFLEVMASIALSRKST